MALLRCHGDSDCNKTQIIRNFRLYKLQLWSSVSHIFTYGDVVNVQTWEVSPQKNPKAFFFDEILINFPSENLPKLSKERMQYFCHDLKLNLRIRHSAASASNCSMNRSLEPKMIINCPLFNSTGFCKVDDHYRQEHRICTYRS